MIHAALLLPWLQQLGVDHRWGRSDSAWIMERGGLDEGAEVADHLVRVCLDVADRVDLFDHPVRPDQEREPPREVLEVVVGVTFGAVRLSDLVVDVAQQREVEALGLGERLVLGRSIEGNAVNARVDRGVLGGSITEPLALDRSTRRRGLRVPPQDHPRAGQVSERDLVAVLVGKPEIRGTVSGVNHVVASRMHADLPRQPPRVWHDQSVGGSTGVVTPRRRLAPLLPARLRAIRRPRWWEEVVFIGASYLLYSLVRNNVPTAHTTAVNRGFDLLDAERTVHIDFEKSLNAAVASVHWLAQICNYWYATMHFGVTIAVLIWLYRWHPLQYRAVRSVLYVCTITALLGFWLFPLAPPRLLPHAGFIDTVVKFHTWGSWGSADVANHSNQYAAMPSLHIGWSLWCAIALFRLTRRWWLRALAVAYPILTLFVIAATANHYVLDAAGGAAVVAFGFAVQRMLSGRPAILPQGWLRDHLRNEAMIGTATCGASSMTQ